MADIEKGKTTVYIMSTDGWKQLAPKSSVLAVQPGQGLRPWDEKYNRDQDPRYNTKVLPQLVGDGRYRGPLPSLETLAFISSLERENAALRERRIEIHGYDNFAPRAV